MRPDARAPLLFAAWYRELSRLIYADELGALFDGLLGRPAALHGRASSSTARSGATIVATAAVEACAALAARALELALADLARRFGDDPATWRWGAAHPARMAHAIFGRAAAARLAVRHRGRERRRRHHGERRPLRAAPTSGSRSRAPMPRASARCSISPTSTRSRFVAATGQSGNPLSPHYHDLTALWSAGVTVTDHRSPAERPTTRSSAGVCALIPQAVIASIATFCRNSAVVLAQRLALRSSRNRR